MQEGKTLSNVSQIEPGIPGHRVPAEDATSTSNFHKHTSSNPIQRWLIQRVHNVVIERIAAAGPTSFLDAGCGEGFVANLLLQRLPDLDLTGFDFNPASVEMARQRVPGATFTVASIFDIPFPDNTFDVVGCFEVLEHQVDPKPALAELARVAKRMVILSVPHEPFFSLSNAMRGKNWDVRPRGSDPDHKQLWTQQAFGEFVKSEPSLDLVWLGGSFPWTIAIARKRQHAGS
jgi:SAM-dependent methyltransferase